MRNKDLNLMQLEEVASALGELLPHVTFVGGSTTVLLVDEVAHHGVRYTEDVDVIVDVATQLEYQKLGKNYGSLVFVKTSMGQFVDGCLKAMLERSHLMSCLLTRKYWVFLIAGIVMPFLLHQKFHCRMVQLFES